MSHLAFPLPASGSHVLVAPHRRVLGLVVVSLFPPLHILSFSANRTSLFSVFSLAHRGNLHVSFTVFIPVSSLLWLLLLFFSGFYVSLRSTPGFAGLPCRLLFRAISFVFVGLLLVLRRLLISATAFYFVFVFTHAVQAPHAPALLACHLTKAARHFLLVFVFYPCGVSTPRHAAWQPRILFASNSAPYVATAGGPIVVLVSY